MTTYYVYSGAGGANTGADWTNAYTAFSSAVAAANTAGDIIKIHYTHQENITASTTYTFLNNVIVLSVNKNSSDALTKMGYNGWIGTSTNVSSQITLAGAYRVFLYGMTLRIGSTGSTTAITVGNTDGAHFEQEEATYWISGTNGANSVVYGIANGTNQQGYFRETNPTYKFAAAGQSIGCNQLVVIEGGLIDPSGTAPTTLFKTSANYPKPNLRANGADFSHISGTLVGDATSANFLAEFVNCKLNASVVVLASQTVVNKSSAQVFLYNCASGDTHHEFAHYDALGQTVAVTSLYISDGASYDGTNRLSWKITTSANCSLYTPYVSPWFDRYHAGTSAITPYIECLRDNSSGAVFQDDEVWGEFSYQGTSGFPLASIVSDRRGLTAAAADQTASSKTASDWTGETGTPGLFKLSPTASITPAEIGHLRARICVGEPSITVYVDPTIRGTT